MMFKRLISVLLILSLMVVMSSTGFTTGASAYPRNGFRLVAVESDSTGIAVDTEFLLETDKDFSLSEVKKALSIDGEPNPNIVELDKNFFSINLARPLLENTIYTFRMKADVETTWVFQTQSEFEILGSLPGNQSIGVPVNSGIEINFSHSNFSDIKGHFEISPHVNGRFQVHDKTAVFVPDGLEYETIYTVKIKKGIKINGTDRVISDDYIFSFETRAKDISQPQDTTITINYNQQITDVSSDEDVELSLRYYIRNPLNGVPLLNVKTNVYAYKDFESFHEAVIMRNIPPDWAQINYNNTIIPIEGLQKVLEFNQSINEGQITYGNAVIKIPQKLPKGYYVVDSYCDDKRAQQFIQVTNTGIFITKSTSKTLVWLNDIKSNQPLANAKISFYGISDVFYSNSTGVSTFDSNLIDALTKGESTDNYSYYDSYYYRYYYGGNYNKQFMSVTTANGDKSLLNTSSYSNGSGNNYWKYFFTDRGMYKPNDTINVWGFIKNRYEDEEINYLTLEISQGYYWGGRSGLPVLKENIDVKDNFFEGEISIPNLPIGYYNITLKKGKDTITNSMIRVEEYVKPSYKMEITKDKVAAFIGDEVNFKINAAFFEGTGVANLNTNYNIMTSWLTGQTINQNVITDTKGNVNVKYIPNVTQNVQGIYSIPINARALLPETGEIRASDSVRVFVNDIDVQTTGEIRNQIGSINTTVHKIVLDRLNGGTAKNYNDYLGDPVVNKQISGTINKNTWVKEVTGKYYDYINKVTYDTYTYRLQTTKVKDFTMITNGNGQASFTFDAPKIADTYYSADISCVDDSGRNMSFRVYVGERIDYSGYYSNNTYSLRSDKSKYRLGESVELNFTFSNNNLPDGKYIYIYSQNGIMDYDVSNKSKHNFTFINDYMPNVNTTAVYFNGKTYASANTSVQYDMEEKKLIIEGKTDKDYYRPGETVNLSVNVKDIDGNPVKSLVNASIVDEAFFSIADQNVNVLASLYSSVTSGIYYDSKSHSVYYQDPWGRSDLENAPPAAGGGMPVPTPDSKDSGNSDIRTDFRDTAKFVSIETDGSGKGQVSFKLPDNVTSWRITLTAISKEINAGSEKTNMTVTLPFFINYSFNNSYLKGDQPVMAVNAYGVGLNEKDDVYFEVYDKDNLDTKITFKGKAFERVNIPLWTLEEGYYNLIIRAYTQNGFSDAVQHSINVVDSYYQLERAEFDDVVAGMEIKAGKNGYTNLTFQDRSKGMYFSQLVSLYATYGNRIDQITSRYIASQLLSNYYSDIYFANSIDKPDLSQYQKNDGGLSLLPYSESDIDLTAKMVVFAKDVVNTQQLKNYFNSKLNDNKSRIKAIYGLAVLKEPVLLMLDQAEKIDNLSIIDTIYLALSYYELGDIYKAESIYNERILKHIEEYAPYYRLNTKSSKDNILEATSLCAYLAAILDKPEKTGLYEYCLRNFTRDILICTEKLMYISKEIDKADREDVKFTYTYDGEERTIELKNGMSHTIRLLPHQLEKFKITDAQGKISLVSVFKESVFDIKEQSNEISVKRSYHYENGTPILSNKLKQGDIIKVRIEWSIKDTAFDGVYEITDYLPSGLKPYRSLRNVEGQKVTFYAYRSSIQYYEYYARVVSPGVYTAQGTVIQGRTSKDIINTAKTEIVTVETDELISKPIDPPPFAPTPKPILYGDLNGDGKINSTDYVLLRRYVLEIIDKFPVSFNAADLNGDGNVNSVDLVILRRYLLVIIDKFPVEQK